MFKINPSKRHLVLFVSISQWLYLGLLILGLPYSAFTMLMIGSVYILISTFIVLRRDLSGLEYLTLFTLPVILYFGSGLLILSITSGSVLRILVWLLYGPLTYAVILSENIFNIAIQKNLPLVRVANTANYLAVLGTTFLITSALYNMNFTLWMTVALLGIVIGFLVLQYLWSLELSVHFSRSLIIQTLLITICIVEALVVLSFIPMKYSSRGLVVTTLLYSILGLHNYFTQRPLTIRIIAEYAIVMIAVFFVALYTV